SFDKTARLWSAVTGEPLGTPLEHPEPVGNVGFSPDGQRIITGGGVDWLWQAPTGKKLISHEYEKIGSNYFRVRSNMFCLDGRIIQHGRSGVNHSFGMWDSATGKNIGAALEDGFYASSVDGGTLLIRGTISPVALDNAL